MVALRLTWHQGRHSAYSTTDLPLHEVPKLDCFLRRHLRRHLLDRVAPSFGFSSGDDLYFKDLFFVKYEAAPGCQNSLQLHRDGSVISFNILLNALTDFKGGGTYFDHCRKVFPIEQGDCISHSGYALHAGNAITQGKRLLLVGFVESSPSRLPWYVRNMLAAPWIEWAELEAKALQERMENNRDGSREGGAQLDVEEDVIRMLATAS